MKILHVDLCSSYPLARAGGHRTMHSMLSWIAQQSDMDCMSLFARRGMGSQLPEYDPTLLSLNDLGVNSIQIEDDRWIFNCGYPALAVDDVNKNLDRVMASYKPDLVWTTGFNSLSLLKKVRKRGCAALWYVQDCRPEVSDIKYASHINIEFAVCSNFINQRLEGNSGVKSTTVYPLINNDDYITKNNTKKYVTFINPRPVKGYNTFLNIAAAMPDVEFLVVEAWPLGENYSEVYNKLCGFSNVTFMSQLTDMREIYQQSRLLLVPSIVEDAAPRVIREAQINGIPVIGSNRGGITEIIGQGGLILDGYQDSKQWCLAIRELLVNESYWENMSQKAFGNALSSRFSQNTIMKKFRHACVAAISRNEQLEMSVDEA